jgi:hypothetical protein
MTAWDGSKPRALEYCPFNEGWDRRSYLQLNIPFRTVNAWVDSVIFKLKLKQSRCVAAFAQLSYLWTDRKRQSLVPRCLPIHRKVRLCSNAPSILEKIGKIPKRVQLIGFSTSAANFEPLLRKDEGYEVFSRPYRSKVWSELPCVLSKQMVACGGKDKRGTRSNGQMTTKEWAGRHRKRQGGVTECRRTIVMPAWIHERRGVEKCEYRARKQRPIFGESCVHEWLEQ